MKTLWKFAVVAALGAACVGSALASPYGHGHRHFGSRTHVGVGFAFGPVWGPWHYPPPYYPSYTVVERVAPPVYVEQAAPPSGAGEADAYWYYCRGANAYYPYAKECPAGWERVAPQPEPR